MGGHRTSASSICFHDYFIRPFVSMPAHARPVGRGTPSTRLLGRGIRMQPGDNLREAEGICLIKASDEEVHGRGLSGEFNSVDREKGNHRSKRHALVAVDKGMILAKALPECRRLFEHVCVITGLRAIKGRFQLPRITHAVAATVALNLILVDGQHFDDGKKLAHSASFLYNDP